MALVGKHWLGRLLRLVVVGVLLGGLSGGDVVPAERLEAPLQPLRVRRASPKDGVVLESRLEQAGAQAEVRIYGPIRAAEGGDLFGLGGVQIPWVSEQDRESEMILAAASGARAIGMDFEWKFIQPEENRWDWEDTDAAVRLARKYNLRVAPMLLYTPDWASSQPFASVDFHRVRPARYSLYRDFVYRVVERYRPYGVFEETHDGYGITDWVIWNEPNIQTDGHDPLPASFWYSSLESYIQLLRAGYEGAHAADPSCNVLNAGLADVYWKPSEADLITAVNRLYDPNGDGDARDGGRPFFDTLNLHIYPPGLDTAGRLDPYWFRDRMEAVIRVMDRYDDSDKKIWITETGYGSISAQSTLPVTEESLPLISEEDQAQAVPFIYQTLAAYSQVERVFWWSLRNYSANPSTANTAMEAHYGLVRVDFSLKPAYLAYMRTAGGAGLVYAAEVTLASGGVTVAPIPSERVQESGGYLVVASPKSLFEALQEPGTSAVAWFVVP